MDLIVIRHVRHIVYNAEDSISSRRFQLPAQNSRVRDQVFQTTTQQPEVLRFIMVVFVEIENRINDVRWLQLAFETLSNDLFLATPPDYVISSLTMD